MHMAKSETGTQLLARLGARPSLSGLESSLFGNGPEAGCVYEFYGGEGTGKTQMTLHLVAKCILPETWKAIYLGGKNTGVVVIDTEYKFPMFRLAVILEHWVKEAVERSDIKASTSKNLETKCEKNTCSEKGKSSDQDLDGTYSEEDIESFIQDCLGKVHILQCVNSFQFLMSLTSLESLISNNPNISMIIVDSISAYYWIDKCQTADGHQTMDTVMKPLISVLTNYVTNYNMVLICVKSALFVKKTDYKGMGRGNNSARQDSSDSSHSIEHSEFLGKSWSKFVSKRLIFAQSTVGNFKTSTVAMNNDDKQPQSTFKISDSGILFIS